MRDNVLGWAIAAVGFLIATLCALVAWIGTNMSDDIEKLSDGLNDLKVNVAVIAEQSSASRKADEAANERLDRILEAIRSRR